VLLRLIRFRQKVLMDKPPLELFSLERKGRPSCRVAFSFAGRFSEPLSVSIRTIQWTETVSTGGRAMFCDQCGGQLQVGEPRCGRCGKTVLGLIELRRSRVREHVRLLGILWMAYSALYVVAGVGTLVVAQTVFGGAFHINGGPPPEVTVWLRPLLTCVAWLILVIAATGFFTGWGLLRREEWARTVALVAGFVALLRIPVGTALGIYTLWVLLPAQSDEEYRALAQAA
jgi:hypothetical protein